MTSRSGSRGRPPQKGNFLLWQQRHRPTDCTFRLTFAMKIENGVFDEHFRCWCLDGWALPWQAKTFSMSHMFLVLAMETAMHYELSA